MLSLSAPIDRGSTCRWLEDAGSTVGAAIVDACAAGEEAVIGRLPLVSALCRDRSTATNGTACRARMDRDKTSIHAAIGDMRLRTSLDVDWSDLYGD